MMDSARMKTSDVPERILHFNQGRHPELLRIDINDFDEAELAPCMWDVARLLTSVLEPTQDRIDLASCGGDLKRPRPILETMGELTAWSQLRCSGRQGSAIADELIAFAERPRWRQDLIRAAQDFYDRVVADYQAYCAAYERGLVGTKS
jgi:uncharacterized protein (DUF2252 family)